MSMLHGKIYALSDEQYRTICSSPAQKNSTIAQILREHIIDGQGILNFICNTDITQVFDFKYQCVDTMLTWIRYEIDHNGVYAQSTPSYWLPPLDQVILRCALFNAHADDIIRQIDRGQQLGIPYIDFINSLVEGCTLDSFGSFNENLDLAGRQLAGVYRALSCGLTGGFLGAFLGSFPEMKPHNPRVYAYWYDIMENIDVIPDGTTAARAYYDVLSEQRDACDADDDDAMTGLGYRLVNHLINSSDEPMERKLSYIYLWNAVQGNGHTMWRRADVQQLDIDENMKQVAKCFKDMREINRDFGCENLRTYI